MVVVANLLLFTLPLEWSGKETVLFTLPLLRTKCERTNITLFTVTFFLGENLKKIHRTILDDQTEVYSKPAGQPEHASLNQCQLIAANGCQNWFSGHPQLVVEIWFLCNVIVAGALIYGKPFLQKSTICL